jgi:AcrR family transcriptional regulator
MATRIRQPAGRRRKTLQPLDLKRRSPVQERAKGTLEVVLEAAARILEQEGCAALNTNHIAERAGISVGTLYQYYSNKDEILVAIARRLFDNDISSALQALAAAGPDHPEPERLVIHTLIDSYRSRRKTRRSAIDAVISEGLSRERVRNVETVAGAILARSSLTPTGAWILTRAVNGVLHATTEEDSPLLATQEFEDELVRLVRGFLSPPLETADKKPLADAIAAGKPAGSKNASPPEHERRKITRKTS